MTHICAESAQHCTTHTHRTPSPQHALQASSAQSLLVQRHTQFQDERSQTQHLSKQSNLRCLTALPLAKYSSKKLTLTLP